MIIRQSLHISVTVYTCGTKQSHISPNLLVHKLHSMKSKTKNFHLQYQISRPNLFDPSMLCCPNHNSKTNTSIKQNNHPSKPGNKPEDFLTSCQQPHMIKDHN